MSDGFNLKSPAALVPNEKVNLSFEAGVPNPQAEDWYRSTAC